MLNMVYIYKYIFLLSYESLVSREWQKNITAELTMRLKQPLLVSFIIQCYRDLD